MAKTLPSASDAAKKWQTNTAGATQFYKDGVNRVTESPTAKAAARVDAYLAGVQRAAQEGTWQKGLQGVSLQQWKDAATNKGAGRIAAGVAQAAPKMQSIMTNLFKVIESSQQNLASLPRGDINANIQRAVAHMTYMHENRASIKA